MPKRLSNVRVSTTVAPRLSFFFFLLSRHIKNLKLHYVTKNAVSGKLPLFMLCEKMRSDLFPFVLEPLRRSLCLFWGEIYTKGPRARSPARPEVEEGRKEGPREDRESQLTKEGRREQSADKAVQRRTQSEEGGNEKMEPGQRRESTEVRKTTAKTC